MKRPKGMFPVIVGVPMPPAREHQMRYPWKLLPVSNGTSQDKGFFVADSTGLVNSVRSGAYQAGPRMGKKFACRVMVYDGQKGVFVWRVE